MHYEEEDTIVHIEDVPGRHQFFLLPVVHGSQSYEHFLRVGRSIGGLGWGVHYFFLWLHGVYGAWVYLVSFFRSFTGFDSC